MPPASKEPDDDDDAADTKAQTPTKPAVTAARRASATKNGTPTKKPSTPTTPKSAPAVAKRISKKPEPTLLQDFLLGRPSPQRTGRSLARKKSLEGVKKELKLGEGNIAKVQPPGGVKDRVKEWQRANAAAVIVDPLAPTNTNGRKEKEQSKGDDAPLRDNSKRPGRRKSKEAEDAPDVEIVVSKQRSKSAAAPKKRVISDSHWMAGQPSPEKKKSPPRQGAKIPKDFLTSLKTGVNPPLSRKIEDWVQRTASVEQETKSNPRRVSKRPDQNASREPEADEAISDEDGHPRRYGTPRNPDETPTKWKGPKKDMWDDGIRVKPCAAPANDGIRIKPLRNPPGGDDGIKIKPLRPRETMKHSQEEDTVSPRTPSKAKGRHPYPTDVESNRDAESLYEDETVYTWTSRDRKASKPKPRRSVSTSDTMSEIPFGNSAFSVLDLPLGAEAGSLKKPAPPRRAPSFAVPKVLKKVYAEAKNIVQDTVDPPRVGVNQPPSIESWLKGTSDPFLDNPSPLESVSDLEKKRTATEKKSSKEPDQSETIEVSKPPEVPQNEVQSPREAKYDSQRAKTPTTSSPQQAPETLPGMDKSTPLSPSNLKRTPATRSTSSPVSARKIPFKDSLLDAFRGESSIYPKGSPHLDISAPRPNRTYSNMNDTDSQQSLKSQPMEPRSAPPRNLRAVSKVEESRSREDKPLPSFARQAPPTNGQHRLSTIASVETFSTSSSLTDSSSTISRTTITQKTASTAPTASSLSRNSKGSSLKRRLTKHSDLVSVLSLPETAPPGQAKSIRSAGSLRTKRTQLENTTVSALMQELAEDESKYSIELKTLVDGVIPVLLTSILSKSDSAIAAGLISTENIRAGANSSKGDTTKPIVDMGIALEHLRTLHTRIPLQDPRSLLAWTEEAFVKYDAFLRAWRSGFQGIVINLEPAKHTGENPLGSRGDLRGYNSERVDVAFLLKRPMARVKYLTKIVKGLHLHYQNDLSQKAVKSWESLEEQARQRVKEENARLVDHAANNTDTTRARDLQTFALREDVKIDQTRQVYAKDFFSMDMTHSTGQRFECQVELLLRDKLSDPNDPGDFLICAVDEAKQFLLFPPIMKGCVSARIGDSKTQVVIMVRGEKHAWSELFLVEAEDEDAAEDWIDLLGMVPLPPPIRERNPLETQSKSATMRQNEDPYANIEIPIGERRRREAEEAANPLRTPVHIAVPSIIKEESLTSTNSPVDLNEAMERAGKPHSPRHARARYHSRLDISKSSMGEIEPARYNTDDCVYDSVEAVKVKHEALMSGGLLETMNNFTKVSLPGDHVQSSLDISKKRQSSAPISPTRNDGAPLPPAHRVSTTPNTLKSAPILDSPTPKARNRRTSSPLKHEYQPSNASHSSYSSEESDYSDYSFSESSDDEELEAPELPEMEVEPALYPKRVTPPGSVYSHASGSLAPSNSASQAPYAAPIIKPWLSDKTKICAMISHWDGQKGRWLDLHPEPCFIVVGPGLIEVFDMNAPRPKAAVERSFESLTSVEPNGDSPGRPLIAQELTPLVNLRQSTAVDIEIQSPPTANSKLRAGNTIRYRGLTVPATKNLYDCIHKARMDNPKFKQLEQERLLNSYGSHAYDAAVAGSRRRFWFGRKRSYRASTRAPVSNAEPDMQSQASSAFSRLRRLSGGGIFNIGHSTIDTANDVSQYTSSSNSTASGPTPPRTPTSPSLAGTMTSSAAAAAAAYMGNENLKIRLYSLETSSRWDEKGAARLTITVPPPGMRQRSSLYHGIERRIVVTSDKKHTEGTVILDEVLGANCFSKLGRTGIIVHVWEELVGDNGEVGQVKRAGGVSGRTRKWLFQSASWAEMNWIYSLCAVGRV